MRILVTLDGSQLAERALAAIAPWAKSWGAEVALLRVLDPAEERETPESGGRRVALPSGLAAAQGLRGIPVDPMRRLTEDRGQALESARVTAEEELRDAGSSYLAGLTWTANVLFAEDAPEAIAAFARDTSVDFVAMSSHGRSGLGEAVFGSVVSEVSRKLSVPTIVVGEQTAVRPQAQPGTSRATTPA